MMSGVMTMRFDEHDPSSEKSDPDKARASLAGLDYSPLPRLTGRSLTIALLVSMGGLIFGYDTGQISGFLEMPDFLDRFGETDAQGNKFFGNVRSGLIVALLSIGTLLGALGAAPVADRLGRRPSISIMSLVVSAGFVVQIAADRAWYQVMIGRFIAGLGVGGLSLLVPMYQTETSPHWIRGAMVSAYQLFITLGILLAACFNYGTVRHHGHSSASWRVVVGLGWLWTLLLGLGILALPETPRFDFRAGRKQRAAETLRRVYGAASTRHWAVHTQLEALESKLRAEHAVRAGAVAGLVGMLRAPRMPYRLALGVLLQMSQQLTGANYFFYYGTTIFRSVQIDSFITQIILNAINFFTTFIGLYLVEHYGRRKSLMAGSAWMFVCLLVFASVGHYQLDLDRLEGSRTPGIVLIVFACLFILGYAATWGPIVWAIQAELFPNRYRAAGMGISTASNWTWNFCIGFFTPFIFSAIDFSYGYVFAACNFAAALLVYFFVIETKDKTLEEIDTMYLERVTPWKSEQWVPPSADEMSRVRRLAGLEVAAGEDATDGGHEAARRAPPGGAESPAGRAEKRDGTPPEESAHREHV